MQSTDHQRLCETPHKQHRVTVEPYKPAQWWNGDQEHKLLQISKAKMRGSNEANP